MKCTRCGFHNLPGLEECGGCGVTLAARLAPEEVYPLRAHERPRGDRWRDAHSRRCGHLSERLERFQSRLQPMDAGVSLGCFLRALPAVIPGLRQFRTRGKHVGGAMLVSAALLLALIPLTLRHPLSDFFLWMLVLLSLGSFCEAWLTEEARRPRPQPAWQWVVVPLYAFSLYLGAYSAGGALVGRWYPTYRIGLTIGEVIARGDVFLVKRLHTPARDESVLRRGSLVAFERGSAPAGIGRIVALDQPYFPFGESALGGVTQVVGRQTALRGILIDDLTYERRTDNAPPERRVYAYEQVVGPVLARINPPRRRAWLAGR